VLASSVRHPYLQVATLEYRGDVDFFNSPTVMWNGSSLGSGSNGGDEAFSYHVFRSGSPALNSRDVEVPVTVVNVNDCPVLSAYPPTEDGAQAYGSGGGGAYATSDDGGRGLTTLDGTAAPDPVPFVWEVKAVGVESDAYKHWDKAEYAPPDEVGKLFGKKQVFNFCAFLSLAVVVSVVAAVVSKPATLVWRRARRRAVQDTF